jgi:TRAP-type C4-dicarboxylate transport system permease large subunit
VLAFLDAGFRNTWMMTFLQVPAKVTALFLSLTADKHILYFLINMPQLTMALPNWLMP